MAPRKGHIPWNKGTGKGWTDPRGYRWVYVTEFGKRVAKREHRVIMEKHLSRRLEPEELVHHKNGVRDDNSIENLEVKMWSEHTADHNCGSERSDNVKTRLAVLATYREEHKRLNEINTDLLEALTDLTKQVGKLPATTGEGWGRMVASLCGAEVAIAKAKGQTP